MLVFLTERDYSREPFGFTMDVLGSTIRSTTFNKLDVNALQHTMTPSFITLDMFALSVTYLFSILLAITITA